MSSTRIKIVETSILLFNNKGLANVRLQDIAEYNDISPGNLTYHFKTKKDLMEYIIYYMIRKLVEIENTQRESLKHMSLYKILRNNIIFLFNYRFFFRDILEIINLVPNAKSVYKDVKIINGLKTSQDGYGLAVLLIEAPPSKYGNVLCNISTLFGNKL